MLKHGLTMAAAVVSGAIYLLASSGPAVAGGPSLPVSLNLTGAYDTKISCKGTRNDHPGKIAGEVNFYIDQGTPSGSFVTLDAYTYLQDDVNFATLDITMKGSYVQYGLDPNKGAISFVQCGISQDLTGPTRLVASVTVKGDASDLTAPVTIKGTGLLVGTGTTMTCKIKGKRFNTSDPNVVPCS